MTSCQDMDSAYMVVLMGMLYISGAYDRRKVARRSVQPTLDILLRRSYAPGYICTWIVIIITDYID